MKTGDYKSGNLNTTAGVGNKCAMSLGLINVHMDSEVKHTTPKLMHKKYTNNSTGEKWFYCSNNRISVAHLNSNNISEVHSDGDRAHCNRLLRRERQLMWGWSLSQHTRRGTFFAPHSSGSTFASQGDPLSLTLGSTIPTRMNLREIIRAQAWYLTPFTKKLFFQTQNH